MYSALCTRIQYSVVIDVVSVMAAYFDVLCVCIVHREEGYSIHLHGALCTCTTGQNMLP